jgi:hypothetical protein
MVARARPATATDLTFAAILAAARQEVPAPMATLDGVHAFARVAAEDLEVAAGLWCGCPGCRTKFLAKLVSVAASALELAEALCPGVPAAVSRPGREADGPVEASLLVARSLVNARLAAVARRCGVGDSDATLRRALLTVAAQCRAAAEDLELVAPEPE